jgi:predicted esterase/catechol 2,3-dioxygenase-like lactoylglutathione lyase family enzyme
MNQSRISAIHHITAIASSATENLEFYEQVLGLRLVKQTVNFDDPYTYHLYYADGAGSPGTIMTFFPWEGIPAGRPGSGMIVAISFSVPLKSMAYWDERLTAKGIDVQRDLRFDEPVLRFRDPHGLPIELIGVSSFPSAVHWQESSVEPSHGLLGFHSATALLNSLDETQGLLAGIMGMELYGKENNRYRFNGMPRFFKRLSEGVFDERDVVRRANELADFLVGAASRYGRSPEKLVALGYSNGANIAAAILLLRPEIFLKAVLLRPMMPLANPPEADLTGKRILIVNGRYDTVIPKESTEKLWLSLEKAGATVEVITIDAGHEIATDDIDLASAWLTKDPELKLERAVG